MASISENIRQIEKELAGTGCRLIGVTKTKSVEEILDAYETGLRTFGENTAGSLDPSIAAHLAYSYGIKIYTIGIGQDGTFQAGTNEEGEPLFTDTQLEETTLRNIASTGKGAFFRATSNDALRAIFSQIDKLEKTQIEQTRYKDTKDFYTIYLTWAIVFLLVWLALKNTFMANALED